MKKQIIMMLLGVLLFSNSSFSAVNVSFSQPLSEGIKSVDPDYEYKVGVYIEQTLNEWTDAGYEIQGYDSLESLFGYYTAERIREYLNLYADDRFFGGFQGTVFIRIKYDGRVMDCEVMALQRVPGNQIPGYIMIYSDTILQ